MSVSSACLPFLASSRLLKISLNFFNLVIIYYYELRIYIRVILFVCCVDLQCKCNIVHIIPIGYFSLYVCSCCVAGRRPGGDAFAVAEAPALWIRACPVQPSVQQGYSSNIVVTRCIPLLNKKATTGRYIYYIYDILIPIYSICFDKKSGGYYIKKKRVQKLYVQRLYYQEVQYLINCNSCNNLI